MKKILLLAIGFIFLVTSIAFGGTVTVTSDVITRDGGMRVLDISCVGVISDTNLTPATAAITRTLFGWYPWRVIIENTSGTTPTADSDVYLRDEGGHDLLDGAGVDQLDNDTRNYITVYTDDPIIDTPYLDVDNQSETTAAYTVTFVFVKQNPGQASGGKTYTIPVIRASNDQMAPSGTSKAVVVDLGEMEGIDGEFTFEFTDVDGAAAGTTIEVYYRESNEKLAVTSDIWSLKQQKSIVTDMNTASGNTNYPYEFYPMPCRYLLIEYTAGTSGTTPEGVVHIR